MEEKHLLDLEKSSSIDSTLDATVEVFSTKPKANKNSLKQWYIVSFTTFLLVLFVIGMKNCPGHMHSNQQNSAELEQDIVKINVRSEHFVPNLMGMRHIRPFSVDSTESLFNSQEIEADAEITSDVADVELKEQSSSLHKRGTNEEKLEKALQQMEKIKGQEAEKIKEALQKKLTLLDREISVNDQKNFIQDLGTYPPDAVVEPSGQKVMILTATDGNGANGMIKNVLQMAESNRREYCDYHNYVYKFMNISQFDLKYAHPVWGKLRAIKKAFDDHPNVEWIWWMDLDIIIMTPEIDLARHLLNKEVMKKRLSYGKPLKHPSYAEYSNIRTPYHPDEPLPANAELSKIDEIEFDDFEYVDFDKIDLLLCQDFWGLNAGSFFIRRSNFVDLLLDYWEDQVFVDREFTFREQDTLGHLNINHRAIREHVGVIPQRMLNSYISDDIWDGFEEGDLAIHFAGCWVPGDCDTRWQRHWAKRKRVPAEYRNSFGE